MANKNQVTLTFAGDTKNLEAAFDKVGGAAGDLDGKIDSNSSSFADWNRKAVIASTAIVAGGVAIGASLVDAGREGIKQDKALAQVFESMGGAGSAAFAQVGDAQQDMSARLGETATDVAAVQTKLATFGDVWADPAKGAENFNRATELAFDLEAAGFGAADSNITQLGKALQDPIEGMSALARAGVTFSDAEKDKIRQLQESGDLLGAQEILYQALESQVGGVAEATTDGGDRMKAMWENLQDTLGRMLIPAFERLMEIGTSVMEWASENSGIVMGLGVAVVGLATGVLAANAAWKIYTATTHAVTMATKLFTVAQRALNLVMRANPIGIIITILFALGAAIVMAYRKSETFRNIVQGVWGGIKTAVSSVWNNVLKPVLKWFQDLPGKIRSALSTLASAISSPFRTAFRGIKNFWNSTVGGFGFSIPSWVPVVGGKEFRIPYLHQGGIVPGAPGTEVLAMLEAGERVSPRGRSGGGVIEIRSGGSRMDDLLVEVLRKAIRVQGGDVQVVLGS